MRLPVTGACIISLAAVSFAQTNSAVFNVHLFGATGDGRTLDTAAISRAIAAANSAGGGTVLFPAGKYLTGTFRLLSNITLDLEPGATIQGSTNIADYQPSSAYGFGTQYGVNSTGEGKRLGIIVAIDAGDIAIVGRGSIDGAGDSFFDMNKPHISPDFDPRYTRQGADFMNSRYGTEFGPVEVKLEGRPGTMIVFWKCKNVAIRDVTLSNAPNWTLHLQTVERAAISGLHILNDQLIPNNDGIDCFECRDVHISDCDIRTGDDAIAIVASDEVQTANCSLRSNSAAIRLEDTRNSTFENLSIDSNRGLAVFGRDGEDTAHVLFSNIAMRTRLITGHWWGKAEPIYIANRSSSEPSEMDDIEFTNITATAQGGALIYGTAESPIRNLLLRNVTLQIDAPPPRIAQSVGGNFDLRWTATTLRDAIFSHEIPAVYGRNFEGFRIRGLKLTWGDNLPLYFSNGILCEDFRDLDMSDFEGRQALRNSTAAAILARNGTGLTIRNSKADAGTGLFLSLSEVKDEGLFVNNDLSQADKAFEPGKPRFTFSGNKMPKTWK